MSFKKRLLSYLKAAPSMPFLTEVEWLENSYDSDSNSVPYITTDITATWDLPFEFTATITKTSANRIFLCGNYPNRLTFYIEVTATNRLRFGSQDSTADDPTFTAFDIYTNSSYPIPLNVPTKVWVKYNPLNDANHTVKYEIGLEALDGSVSRTDTGTCYRAGSPSSDARKKLNIFNDWRSAIATADGGYKMHQCEIKLGTVHKKFIPCLDMNRIPCMYEQVEGKLYYNNGTGGFNVGRRIVEVEYMMLTGWQRFNTGFLPNELSTTLKATFEITPNSLETFPFGVRKLQGYEESCAMYIGPVVSGSPNGYLRLDWPLRAGGSTARYNFTATTEKITLEATGNYSKVNGQVLTANTVVDFTHPKPFYIGNCYTESSGQFQSAFKGKFYVVNLLNTYTREDYRYCVPAHDENNVGFFFDRTNHFIMDNEGQNTQDMTWGDEIHPVGFLYGGAPDRFNTGIPFYGNKWETDSRFNQVRNNTNLMGVAAGACNYWGVLSNGSAALYGQYSIHTSDATYGLNIDPAETRTVFLDSFNDGSLDNLKMTVEGQSVTRTTSDANKTTGYRVPDFSTSYPEPAYIYGNRCYDRETNEVLQNAIIVQNEQKQPILFDTLTHSKIDTISSGTTIKLGPDVIGYSTNAQLPYGFAEVDYLESTGTQYLNTDITPTNNMGIDVEYAYPTISNNTNAGICGTYQGTSPRTDAFFVTTVTGKTTTNIILAHAGQSRNTGITPTANTWYNAKINWLNDGYLNLDGSTWAIGTNTIESDKLIIFGRTLASDSSIAITTARIRRYRMTDGLRISHDYVPVIRLYDNKPGMFDLITRQFLTNVGTGEFAVGINGVSYTPADYLQSTGQQYIDTGIKIDDTCGFYVDAEKTASTDSIIIGVKGSGNSRWAYNPSTTNMNLSWNTIYTASTGSVTARHKVKVNVFNDRQRVYDLVIKNAITETLHKNASTYNVCLFGAKWNSETVQLLSSCKMYSAFITKMQDIIGWYLPMVRLSDSKAGMVDIVTNSFLVNGGSGTDFTAGTR